MRAWKKVGRYVQVDDQKRYSRERKAIGSLECLCLSYTFTHTYTSIHSLCISLCISLPLSLISGVEGKRTDRSICQHQLPIFLAVRLLYSMYVSITQPTFIIQPWRGNTRRDTTRDTNTRPTKTHCFTIATVLVVKR